MAYGVEERGRKPVAIWLYVIAFMVLCLVLVGGLTRLTGSGLSMVDWKPIMGSIPPLSEQDWLEKFEQYRQFPEYQKINKGMALDDFKFIFYMEYGHRLLGRLVGLVFFFPFVFFWLKGWLGRPMKIRGTVLFLLGGLQGLMGWYMVQSGLVDEPRVSQYRLTAHLSLAILVYSLSIWFAFSLRPPDEPRGSWGALRKLSIIAVVVIGLQILSGGFVAGLDAGHAFNTFPTMNGQWWPAGIFAQSPWIANLFENPVTVQFIHRHWAYVATALVLWLYFRGLKEAGSHPALHLLLVALVIQVGLGIATLLMKVPVSLGSMHQMGSLFLWTVLLWICHRSCQPG